MSDLISRQAAIDAVTDELDMIDHVPQWVFDRLEKRLRQLPPAQSERLTDDDFETIRMDLCSIKEGLCNQHRWKEAEEYERIIDRFIAFAYAQPERKKGKWINGKCSECGEHAPFWCMASTYYESNYCPNCGSYNGGEQE